MLDSDQLRKKAEFLLSKKGIIDNTLFQKDLKELVEELSIYKIELEHQNLELKQSQQALTKAKDKYIDLFQHAPLGYIILDKDYVIKEINQTACSMLALDAKSLRGKEFTKFIHPLYQDTFYFFFQPILKKDKEAAKSCDIELKKSDYTSLSVRIHRQNSCLTDGIEYIRLSVTDISSERFLEKNLVNETEKAYKSEQMFKLIAENTSDGIMLTSANGNIEYMSPTYFKQLGLSDPNDVGTTIYDTIEFVHPDDRKHIMDTYQSAAHNQLDSIVMTLRVKHIDGHYIWRENHVSLLYNQYGEHINTIELCRDITKRKESEKRLQEQTDTLDQIFKNAPYVLLMLDKNLQIENINQVGLAFTNKDLENSLGNRGGAVFNCINSFSKGGCGINPDCKNCLVRNSATHTLETGESITSREAELTVIINNEKKELNILISTNLLQLNGEKKVLMSIVDNTERKKTERELNKIAKLESLGVLSGGIAHNFKNILTAMSLSVEIIRKIPSKTDLHLNRIAKSISQATSLVNKFQTFSKGGSPELRPTDLHQTIKDSADMVLSGSSSTVKYSFSEAIKHVSLDDKQIQEVFANILINADQAMPKGGIINITTDLVNFQRENKYKLNPGAYIRIDFEDEGIGIPKSHMDEIFTPFFSTKDKGQGLGLSTVFYIVTKHNGRVLVESTPEIGSVLTIYLPYKPLETHNIESKREDLDLPKEHLIYLLDDDLNILDSIEDLSEAFDLNIVTFSDPHAIIESYQKDNAFENVSMVILDLTLKGFKLNGHDVLLELKKINPKIKALVFSGHSTMPIVANYKEYGFTGRIQKPFNMQQFVNEIETMLEME